MIDLILCCPFSDKYINRCPKEIKGFSDFIFQITLLKGKLLYIQLFHTKQIFVDNSKIQFIFLISYPQLMVRHPLDEFFVNNFIFLTYLFSDITSFAIIDSRNAYTCAFPDEIYIFPCER